MLDRLFRVGVRPALFKGAPVLEADYNATEIRSPEMNTICGTRLESPCPPIHIGSTSTTTAHNTYTHPSSPISFDALIPDMAFDLGDQSKLKFNEARMRDDVNIFADEVDGNGEVYLFWPIEEDDGDDSETELLANPYGCDAWFEDFDDDDSSDYFFEASAIPGAFGGEGETDKDIELELCSDDGALCLSEDEPFDMECEADGTVDDIIILDEMYCERSHEDPLSSETGRGIRRLEDARKWMNPQMSEEEDILADSEDVPEPAVSLWALEMDLETHAPAGCGSQGVVCPDRLGI
ncbi:hypothetical protein BD410DRAFT_794007 [Rickenella mellea]|uniref:Uncharacterized protein n=1 Tax=Rickenella mellea TaxID=50990 RepID=A0A4Y7PT55_9AGAM|nr:hypothetical protein BD410DRAFT_794007 [Rickenella mellea]